MTPTVKPILFTGEMVRAILDGRKTQTRRALKSPFPKQHPKPVNLAVHGEGDRGYSGEFNDPDSWGYPYAEDGCDMPLSGWPELNPYGSIGDYLWVRESCYATAGGEVFQYKADHALVALSDGEYWESGGNKKSVPSIHMPRWASRLTLQITGIRVERVQDITKADAFAEGISRDRVCNTFSPVDVFEFLWDSINFERGFAWHLNPWVWAISFTPILKNIDDVLAEREAA